jgi:hypothetical protein
VRSESNAQGKNNFHTNHFKKQVFRDIFYIVIVNTGALFTEFYTSPNDGGELTCGDSSDDPLLARLKAVLGQPEANQL